MIPWSTIPTSSLFSPTFGPTPLSDADQCLYGSIRWGPDATFAAAVTCRSPGDNNTSMLLQRFCASLPRVHRLLIFSETVMIPGTMSLNFATRLCPSSQKTAVGFAWHSSGWSPSSVGQFALEAVQTPTMDLRPHASCCSRYDGAAFLLVYARCTRRSSPRPMLHHCHPSPLLVSFLFRPLFALNPQRTQSSTCLQVRFLPALFNLFELAKMCLAICTLLFAAFWSSDPSLLAKFHISAKLWFVTAFPVSHNDSSLVGSISFVLTGG